LWCVTLISQDTGRWANYADDDDNDNDNGHDDYDDDDNDYDDSYGPSSSRGRSGWANLTATPASTLVIPSKAMNSVKYSLLL